jgi:hypothetical protein
LVSGPAWHGGGIDRLAEGTWTRSRSQTALIAEEYLNLNGNVADPALLREGESIADDSTRADEEKQRSRGSAPWHYLDIPLDQDRP